MASVRESIATSPAVKLLDGSYVPCVPARAYVLTDRKEGWIREALYCALHLVDAGLVEPDSKLADWTLNDLEDRIFMSEESGYGRDDHIIDPTVDFFPYSGFTLQPNLLNNGIAFLQRGQVPNFLRTFFNTYAASIYDDITCFAEAEVYLGQAGGPMYKTPDESKFIQFIRQMLVMEMGSDLCIGRGVPRAWMTQGKVVEFKEVPTYFGQVDVKITSQVADGRIVADLNLPPNRGPHSVILSLRHPEGKPIKAVSVNGRQTKKFDPMSGEITILPAHGRINVIASY
jgi:hypothetical protein